MKYSLHPHPPNSSICSSAPPSKVGLNSGKIVGFEQGDSGQEVQDLHEDDGASPPPSPRARKERVKDKDKDRDDALSGNSTSSGTSAANTRKQPTATVVPPPTGIRRSSICSSHVLRAVDLRHQLHPPRIPLG